MLCCFYSWAPLQASAASGRLLGSQAAGHGAVDRSRGLPSTALQFKRLISPSAVCHAHCPCWPAPVSHTQSRCPPPPRASICDLSPSHLCANLSPICLQVTCVRICLPSVTLGGVAWHLGLASGWSRMRARVGACGLVKHGHELCCAVSCAGGPPTAWDMPHGMSSGRRCHAITPVGDGSNRMKGCLLSCILSVRNSPGVLLSTHRHDSSHSRHSSVATAVHVAGRVGCSGGGACWPATEPARLQYNPPPWFSPTVQRKPGCVRVYTSCWLSAPSPADGTKWLHS